MLRNIFQTNNTGGLTIYNAGSLKQYQKYAMYGNYLNTGCFTVKDIFPSFQTPLALDIGTLTATLYQICGDLRNRMTYDDFVLLRTNPINIDITDTVIDTITLDQLYEFATRNYKLLTGGSELEENMIYELVLTDGDNFFESELIIVGQPVNMPSPPTPENNMNLDTFTHIPAETIAPNTLYEISLNSTITIPSPTFFVFINGVNVIVASYTPTKIRIQVPYELTVNDVIRITHTY